MELSNKQRTRTIKRRFNIVVFCFIAIIFYFVWEGKDVTAIFVGLGLVVFVVFILVINFNYIYFDTKDGKISVKYYPIIALFGREYNSIDFPQKLLLKYDLKVSLLFSDLTLTVKTKRGVADYPQISLTALKKEDIELVRQELERILSK